MESDAGSDPVLRAADFRAVVFLRAEGFRFADVFFVVVDVFLAARAALAAAFASRAAVSASTSPGLVTLNSRSSSAPHPQHFRDFGRRSSRDPHPGHGRSFSGGLPTAQSHSG